MAYRWRTLLVLAAVLTSAAGTFVPSAPAGDVVSKETIDAYFRLEWSKSGRKVNGYVYNSSNRRAGHMQLLVEGLDPAGAVVSRTPTSVRDVPPNNRAFFEVSVGEAPAYRVSIVSFDWVEERDRIDRRRSL
jgi:hypothetical protein